MKKRSDVLEVRLAGDVSRTIHLYVGEAVKAEIACGIVETERDWLAEISAARAAKAGLSFFQRVLADMVAAEGKPDGTGSSERDRRLGFATGFLCGLKGEKREHPALKGAWMPPDHEKKGAAAFEQGWSLGMAIVRATEIALGAS